MGRFSQSPDESGSYKVIKQIRFAQNDKVSGFYN